MFKISKYLITQQLPTDQAKTLYYSTRTGQMVAMRTEITEHINSKQWHLLSTNELLQLTRNEILVPEDEDELSEIMAYDRYTESSREVLGVTIQPTANCQLGCHYCGQVHSKNKMTDEVMLKTITRIKNIIEAEKYRDLKITWYGGEPLMALALIERFYDQIKSYCVETNINYDSDIITNGLLLKPDYFKKLMEFEVRAIQVTIDGPKSTHDQRRITKGGKGTYDVIMANLKNCLNSEEFETYKPSILLRINIDSTNYGEVDNLIELLKEEGIFNKVNVHFAPVVEWGDNNADKLSLTKQQFAEKEIDWMISLYQNGKMPQELIPDRKSYSCMVDDINSEAYDAYGNVYPCYEFPYTPMYQTDDCIEGNVLEDTDFKDKRPAKIRSFKETLPEREYSYCIDCNLLPVCHGSCPKIWMQGGNACPTFKYNIKDRMLLQYVTLNNKP
ncbi:radical SAM/SPASM domain-containing protein [Flavobacterium sp. NRK1]|uniref:radical SAM/SPASM domain-containing protein n=1 Tax=Flavobacterium sp. NRK1 TaxID=2954929 RepID=UPI002092C531|nr:radical SAM protein [Flavobacterium sp. NRK1]MCO6148906.1 radical SAM protein [Flavobacterium sp. NRK1]